LSHQWIRFQKIQKLNGPESEKLMKSYFQLLTFRVIQFLDLLKDDEKNDKKDVNKHLIRKKEIIA
jgi:hypothetical protein